MDQKNRLAEFFVPKHIYEEGRTIECEIYCGLSELYRANALHWHNHYELEITFKGFGTEIINSSMYPMRRGEAHVIFPADTHTFKSEKNVSFCFIQFERKHLSDDMHRRLEQIKNDPVVYLPEEACNIIEKIYNAMSATNEGFEINDPISIKVKERLLDAALTIFLEYSSKKTDLNANAYLSLPIQKIIRYITEKFQSPISTEAIAREFNYNTAYFRRYFRDYTGMSPRDYINSLRLKHAAKLLITSDLRVADVCFNCGYTSMASFQRNFKAQYNMTPLEFKAQYAK